MREVRNPQPVSDVLAEVGIDTESPPDPYLYVAFFATDEPQEVYFLRNPLTGHIKVGISKDVRGRVRQIEMQSGIEMELLGTCGGGKMVEQVFHDFFRFDRRVGEWFEPSPALTDCIARTIGRQVVA